MNNRYSDISRRRCCGERQGTNIVSQGNCHDPAMKLKAVDFAIQETVLYLDAYPCDEQALKYYHELLEVRCGIVKEYEGSCAPITMMGNKSTTSWDWISSPWPWEYNGCK